MNATEAETWPEWGALTDAELDPEACAVWREFMMEHADGEEHFDVVISVPVTIEDHPLRGVYNGSRHMVEIGISGARGTLARVLKAVLIERLLARCD